LNSTCRSQLEASHDLHRQLESVRSLNTSLQSRIKDLELQTTQQPSVEKLSGYPVSSETEELELNGDDNVRRMGALELEVDELRAERALLAQRNETLEGLAARFNVQGLSETGSAVINEEIRSLNTAMNDQLKNISIDPTVEHCEYSTFGRKKRTVFVDMSAADNDTHLDLSRLRCMDDVSCEINQSERTVIEVSCQTDQSQFTAVDVSCRNDVSQRTFDEVGSQTDQLDLAVNNTGLTDLSQLAVYEKSDKMSQSGEVFDEKDGESDDPIRLCTLKERCRHLIEENCRLKESLRNNVNISWRTEEVSGTNNVNISLRTEEVSGTDNVNISLRTEEVPGTDKVNISLRTEEVSETDNVNISKPSSPSSPEAESYKIEQDCVSAELRQHLEEPVVLDELKEKQSSQSNKVSYLKCRIHYF